MLVNRIHPCSHIIKGLLFGEIECYDHAIGLSVELISDGFESFLSRGVPNLHVICLLTPLISSLYEIYSQGLNVLISKFLIVVLLQYR